VVGRIADFFHAEPARKATDVARPSAGAIRVPHVLRRAVGRADEVRS
jgi:hypothetical protein